MEKKLKKLFDFQHFEKNAHLEKLISETECRFGRELSDDELAFVNAAGVQNFTTVNNNGQNENIWGEGQSGEIKIQ